MIYEKVCNYFSEAFQNAQKHNIETALRVLLIYEAILNVTLNIKSATRSTTVTVQKLIDGGTKN